MLKPCFLTVGVGESLGTLSLPQLGSEDKDDVREIKSLLMISEMPVFT